MGRRLSAFEQSLDWFYLGRTAFLWLPVFGLCLVNLPGSHLSAKGAFVLIPALMLLVGAPLGIATLRRRRLERGENEPTPSTTVPVATPSATWSPASSS